MGRKRKAKVVEPPPPPEPPVDPKYWLPKRLKDWVELRSKPKKVVRPKTPKKRKLTRFQKKGPVNFPKFKKWYKSQMKKLEVVYQKTLKLAAKVKKEKLKRKRKNRIQIEEIDWYRIEELATPRWYTPKYEIPREEDFPYAPKLDLNKPAKKSKGRPFIHQQIPKCFAHEILEMDFWFKYRFRISKAALIYTASSRIKALAEPRVIPQNPPHCPIPANTEYIDPRQKMSPPRWSRHKKYLKFFALPKHKMYPRRRPEFMNRGKKGCINTMKDGIENLSKPKMPQKFCRHKEPKMRYLTESAQRARLRTFSKRLDARKRKMEICPPPTEIYGVKDRAKKGKASGRTKKLAVPKMPLQVCTYETRVCPTLETAEPSREGKECYLRKKTVCPDKYNPFVVKRAALKACPSKRTKQLAMPKRPNTLCTSKKVCPSKKAFPSKKGKPCFLRRTEVCPDEKGKTKRKNQKTRNKFSYTCKKRQGFPCHTFDTQI